MEPAPVPSFMALILWRGLLLTVSLLTFWNPPTTAQLTIKSEPSSVAEGQNVLLLVFGVPWNINSYIWYKGAQALDSHQIAVYVIDPYAFVPGTDYRRGGTVYRNGSLLLRRASLEDTGIYTLQVLTRDFHVGQASVQLRVLEPVTRPSVQATNSTVTANGAVTLTCLPRDTRVSVRWLFNDESLQLTEGVTLSQNNSTLSIDPARREDAGEYKCELSNPVSSSQSDALRLTVNPE